MILAWRTYNLKTQVKIQTSTHPHTSKPTNPLVTMPQIPFFKPQQPKETQSLNQINRAKQLWCPSPLPSSLKSTMTQIPVPDNTWNPRGVWAFQDLHCLETDLFEMGLWEKKSLLLLLLKEWSGRKKKRIWKRSGCLCEQ